MVQVILNTSSHEHERDPRKLWAEWLAIPSLCIYLDSMLSSMEDILANLCIYPDTMIENINKYKNDIISEYVLSCLSKSLEKQKAKEILNNILKLSKRKQKIWSRSLITVRIYVIILMKKCSLLLEIHINITVFVKRSEKRYYLK